VIELQRIKQKIRHIILFVMVVQILYVIPALVSAQNNHVITDPEGDVVLETYTDRIEGVERPNIDITRAGIAKSNGIVTISLTVKGIITSSADINYHITIRDEYKWNAGISYNDGICKMEWTDLEDNIKEIYFLLNSLLYPFLYPVQAFLYFLH